MATRAECVMEPKKRQKIRRPKHLRLVDDRGEHIPQAVLIEASERFRAGHEREQQVRAMARRPSKDDSPAMRFASRVVEERIVKGLWVLEISLPSDGPVLARKNGLEYFADHADQWGEAVARGGWTPPPPRPAVPSNREIDAAREAKKWIEWLDEEQARLLTVAAMTKRGDRLRGVNWDAVKVRLPQHYGTSPRTLRDRYDRALRHIVAELTVAKLA